MLIFSEYVDIEQATDTQTHMLMQVHKAMHTMTDNLKVTLCLTIIIITMVS